MDADEGKSAGPAAPAGTGMAGPEVDRHVDGRGQAWAGTPVDAPADRFDSSGRAAFLRRMQGQWGSASYADRQTARELLQDSGYDVGVPQVADGDGNMVRHPHLPVINGETNPAQDAVTLRSLAQYLDNEKGQPGLNANRFRAIHDARDEPHAPADADAPAPDALSPFQQEQYRDSYDPRLFAPRGGAYRKDQVKDYSRYNTPIVHAPGEPGGYSRRVGDASVDTQLHSIDAIVSAGRAAGLTDRQLALTLAIARVESGFNPDAAAGTTSASGLGQFVDKTGAAYGLDHHNRFDTQAQANALVQETINNMAHALRTVHGGKDLERYTYAYHHDRPQLDQGGLGLADQRVLPLVDVYEQYLRTR